MVVWCVEDDLSRYHYAKKDNMIWDVVPFSGCRHFKWFYLHYYFPHHIATQPGDLQKEGICLYGMLLEDQ